MLRGWKYKKYKSIRAIGTILCHDITQIIPSKFKGRAFKKGHIITEDDVKVLLSIGKEHIFVWEHKEGTLYENEAITRLKGLIVGLANKESYLVMLIDT
jgi:hypothetical protein